MNSITGKDNWLKLIQFIESSKDVGRGCCAVGTRVPSVKIHQKRFEFAMGMKGKDLADRKYKVKKGKWYSILITQKLENGTVGTDG